jgi:hypothetical protein
VKEKLNWLWPNETKKWMEEGEKKKETSLMLLVAVNKFQPNLPSDERRKRRAKRTERSEMCVKKRFFCLWLSIAFLWARNGKNCLLYNEED